MESNLAQRRRHTFVMLRVETLEACDGDANLAVIADYVRWRAEDYGADRHRTGPSGSLWLDEDDRVWVRCSTQELSEAVVQSPRTMERRLTKLVEMGVLDRRQDIGHWSDRCYWYAPLAEPKSAERVPERAAGKSAERVVVPVPVETRDVQDNERALLPADCVPVRSMAETFERWWAVYPRRQSKKAARAIFERIVTRKEATIDELMVGAERYRDDPNREDAYTKHPTTWLNQGCWADELLPQRARSTQAARNSDMMSNLREKYGSRR